MTALRSLLLALLFSTGIVVPTTAQDRSYPARNGYVVTAEGDTLRGLVEDRSAPERARYVRFKGEEEAQAETLRPSFAQGYGFEDGARYRSRTVLANPEGPEVTVFLRVLVDGPRALYAYPHAPGEDRYYVEGADFPVEGLYRTKEEVHQDGRLVQKTRLLYTGTLTRAFVACGEARNAASGIRYTARDLARVVVTYNRCVEPSYVPEPIHSDAGDGWLILRPALWVGVGRDQLATRRSDYAGTALLLGAEFDIRARGLSRFSLIPGVSYRFNEAVYGGFETGAYRSGLLALSLGARYTHPFRWAQPYVGASYVFGLIVGSAQEDNPLLPALYGIDLKRDAAESGVAYEAGFTRPFMAGTDLVLGARHERTASFSGDIGSPRFERQATSLVLGLRF